MYGRSFKLFSNNNCSPQEEALLTFLQDRNAFYNSIQKNCGYCSRPKGKIYHLATRRNTLLPTFNYERH